MSEAADGESVTIAAVPEQVRLARAFVAAVLGESHPRKDLAVLLASELVTNSVVHSGSAVPGGLVTVAVAAGAGGIRVEVTDRSGDSAPVLSPAALADGDAEGRRGLALVDELAARWGYQRGGGLTTTWFELAADLAIQPGPGVYLPWTWLIPGMYLPLTWTCRERACRVAVGQDVRVSVLAGLHSCQACWGSSPPHPGGV